MIKIQKVGEVKNEEIFARDSGTTDVAGAVAAIIADVRERGDAALFEYTERFDRVKLTSLEVILWDERRTTVDAHRILSNVGKRGKKRKKTVDAVAASLILEGYLGSVK